MKNRSPRLILLIICSIGPFIATAWSQDSPPAFQEGLERIHRGMFRQALDASDALRKNLPQKPFGDVLAVEAYWETIYCQTGHINSREIWNLSDSKTSPYDKDFFQAADRASQLTEQMRLRPETAAIGALYAGLVHGARSRLFAVREQSLQSAGEAKKMRADLLAAIVKDPKLEPDANFGLGTYNYYADALSPVLKVFRFFLGIPGGNREKGLEQLRMASQQSRLCGVSAKFELARIYGVREGRHAEAVLLFKELSGAYPGNVLYALSAAFQAEQAGNRNAAVEYSRSALEAAAKMDAGCRERLIQAATGAVERLQGRGADAKSF